MELPGEEGGEDDEELPGQLGVRAGALSCPPEPQVEEGAGETPRGHQPRAKGLNQNFKVGRRACGPQTCQGGGWWASAEKRGYSGGRLQAWEAWECGHQHIISSSIYRTHSVHSWAGLEPACLGGQPREGTRPHAAQ